jgi:hypothetical protein
MYHLLYNQTPLRVFRREIRHYAFSMGVFTGIGSAPIGALSTRDALDIYYDGFINLSGVAAILVMEHVTLGLTLGFDHLLDKNRKVWLYQGKPWVGLSVGLNLN